ncbi:hypothetical protein [Endozoicomonas sp. ALB032]|uniref:hypothetical protein n=1 Tax=Endozoicomonas sp. ALB032 TaxID=3403082 RepID=UPI003BB4BFAF
MSHTGLITSQLIQQASARAGLIVKSSQRLHSPEKEVFGLDKDAMRQQLPAPE